MITATKRMAAKGHRLLKEKPSSAINVYPQVAGNIVPTTLKAFGSKSIENRIPDSIMDGRNISCEIMVSFACFFTASPKTLPTLNDTAIKTASEPKYNGRFAGGVASKAMGATEYMIADISNR